MNTGSEQEFFILGLNECGDQIISCNVTMQWLHELFPDYV